MYQVRDLNLGITNGPCQILKLSHVTEFPDYFPGQFVYFAGGANLSGMIQSLIQDHAWLGWNRSTREIWYAYVDPAQAS